MCNPCAFVVDGYRRFQLAASTSSFNNIWPTDMGEIVKQVVATRAALAWRARKVEVIADVPPALPAVLAFIYPEHGESFLAVALPYFLWYTQVD